MGKKNMVEPIPKPILKKYYMESYPFKLLHSLYNITSHRELTFRLNNTIFLRNQIFKNFSDFESAILEIVPSQLDIGSSFTFPATKKNIMEDSRIFKTYERELVFDVDVTDYDRNCGCRGTKNMCNECFKLAKAAMEHLNRVLRHNFGYKRLLFVYSGGKGMHCWVFDERARKLPAEGRRAILNFLKNYREKTIKNIYDKYGLDIKKDHIVLDAEVTTNFRHLLKLPFSVHSNGKVSVPVDIKNIFNLKIEDFPNVNNFEIEEFKQKYYYLLEGIILQ